MTKYIFAAILFFVLSCRGNPNLGALKTGAEQPELYLPLLQNKNVALVVNNTSRVGSIHLVDFLLGKNIQVKTIFAPEHGFRGNVSDGVKISDGVDAATGIPVVSLYGKTRKPTEGQLKDIDVVVFDIQDVGCRFYTFISTLHLVLEACAEKGIPLIVLDRPNPNGDYIAGPVLEPRFRSFVGMDPLPVVHGCTVGELAKMINGEHWHNAANKCELTVIPVKNYSHRMHYLLPVKPSPNLPNNLAIRLYPSLCFFEATSISVGRGTEFPFQALGGLNPELGDFQFTPKSIPGVAIHPPNEGKTCFGIDFRKLKQPPAFTLKYFLSFYKKFEKEEDFLTRERWFNLLAGTDQLIRQIREGKSETEIKKSWQPKLKKYKALREKYLLYPDFK